MRDKRLLLVISGGIAAYRALELIRALRERGAALRCVMTAAAERFVTPLSAAALSGDKVFTDLFSLTDEAEMGHIRLAREADLVVVAPATADLMAKMAAGLADDLASTVLLATDRPVLLCPAMNAAMWRHPATRRNAARLEADGVCILGPDAGDLACGEVGHGRMSQPAAIADAIAGMVAETGARPLVGRHALVTSGPTREPIDPVRFIANHSSGKQGHAIAAALAALGSRVTLVSGPVALGDPAGVEVVKVETARDMLAACDSALPADVAVCVAAVADWRVAECGGAKLERRAGAPPVLALAENPDILATLAASGERRPDLVVGFAAETGDVVARALRKRERKGCDWIVANDVSAGSATFGGDDNTVHLITPAGVEDWPRMDKRRVAERLARRVASQLAG